MRKGLYKFNLLLPVGGSLASMTDAVVFCYEARTRQLKSVSHIKYNLGYNTHLIHADDTYQNVSVYQWTSGYVVNTLLLRESDILNTQQKQLDDEMI
ncbi:hypothetical protein TB1_033462 [Malus domestica]